MYSERPIDHIKRTQGIPFSNVRGNKAVLSQKRNGQTQDTGRKSLSLSYIDIQPMAVDGFQFGLVETEQRQLASLLVETVRELVGNIGDWTFSGEQHLEDLMLKCAYELRERAGVDFIEVHKEGGAFRLLLKRFVCSRGTVYGIPLRQIFKLRGKHRSLFHILVSFVKSLPYIGLFDTQEGRVDWLWEYLYEEYAHQNAQNKSLPFDHPVNFFARHEKWYDAYETQDWTGLLKVYRPRKPLHREIRELLLEASKIDFHVPFRLSVKDTEENFFEHNECILLVDHEDSDFTQNYIQMLNECSNDHDIISAYQYTVAEKGDIQPFENDLALKLRALEAFLSDLNDLLRKL